MIFGVFRHFLHISNSPTFLTAVWHFFANNRSHGIVVLIRTIVVCYVT